MPAAREIKMSAPEVEEDVQIPRSLLKRPKSAYIHRPVSAYSPVDKKKGGPADVKTEGNARSRPQSADTRKRPQSGSHRPPVNHIRPASAPPSKEDDEDIHIRRELLVRPKSAYAQSPGPVPPQLTSAHKRYSTVKSTGNNSATKAHSMHVSEIGTIK
jgi:hypothetical protein